MMIGQKAVNLEKLKKGGINVPEFSVISYEQLRKGQIDLSTLSVLQNNYSGKFAVRSSASVEGR